VRALPILIDVLEVLYGFRRSEYDLRNDLVELSVVNNSYITIVQAVQKKIVKIWIWICSEIGV
jgi:hypothetical protein